LGVDGAPRGGAGRNGTHHRLDRLEVAALGPPEDLDHDRRTRPCDATGLAKRRDHVSAKKS
jgi:hypothetical protein